MKAALAATVACVSLAAAGCSREAPATIVITVSIDTGPGLQIPDDINHLRIKLATGSTSSLAMLAMIA